jgi:hypothetical protein
MCDDPEGMEILGSLEFSGFTDAWTEYLCLKRLPEGGIELSSRSFELLGYGREWFGDPVWPEGYDPDADDANDADEEILPVSVGGKLVRGRDGDATVGHELVPHDDDALVTFRHGEFEEALSWLEGYGWTKVPNFEAVAEKIKDALS